MRVFFYEQTQPPCTLLLLHCAQIVTQNARSIRNPCFAVRFQLNLVFVFFYSVSLFKQQTWVAMNRIARLLLRAPRALTMPNNDSTPTHAQQQAVKPPLPPGDKGDKGVQRVTSSGIGLGSHRTVVMLRVYSRSDTAPRHVARCLCVIVAT